MSKLYNASLEKSVVHAHRSSVKMRTVGMIKLGFVYYFNQNCTFNCLTLIAIDIY